jgi:hypothetical protein
LIMKNWISLSLVLIALSLMMFSGCRPTESEDLPTITAWEQPKKIADKVKLTNIEPDEDGIKLMNVGLAEDGAMITVNFFGPGKTIKKWNQGDVYIVDESSGAGYSQIPVAPVIGPLFGKPTTDKQGRAYVMLSNPDNGIKTGSKVSVILGKYKREHVVVQ